MDFEKLITERYSVRNFKPSHLSQETIDKILEAGHKAPTGCNYQPQRILVLNTDESIAKLKECTKAILMLLPLCLFVITKMKVG